MRSKRVLSMFLSLVMAASIVAGMVAGAAGTTSFSDISGHWAEEALTHAVENGLLCGMEDGSLRPDDKLTRAQLAAIVVRAFAAEEKADLSAFADADKDAWYYEELSQAAAMGVLKGDGVGMRPEDNITRQEAFTVITRLLLLKEGDGENLKTFGDHAQVADWAVGSVSALVEKGLVKGNDANLLKPTEGITRAEFATIFDRAISGYIRGGNVEMTEVKNLAVTGAATLKGVKITGDLYIGEGVGTNAIILDGVTVEGNLIIRGGAKVILRNGAKIKGEVVRKDGLTTPVVTEGGTGGNGGGSVVREYSIQQTYTYEQVQNSFSATGLQGSVKQYVDFLTDPSYGTGNDAAFDALDLANTETFVNKDFTMKPSLFPSLRNVASSVLSEDRTELWLAYTTGGADCVDVETGEFIAQYTAEELKVGDNLLLVADSDNDTVYVIGSDAVTLIAR